MGQIFSQSIDAVLPLSKPLFSALLQVSQVNAGIYGLQTGQMDVLQVDNIFTNPFGTCQSA